MNVLISGHFDEIEARLVSSPAVVSYQIIRREVASVDGKFRLKAVLNDGGLAELFEYVAESGGRIHLLKYSFHWQSATGQIVRRWDNTPHHMHLASAPHHIHESDGSVREVIQVPDASFVISEIETALA